MTLALGLVVPDGVVMAADSRQTFVHAGILRIGSDNAIKLFQLTDTIVGATSGHGFLIHPPGGNFRNIATIVEEFKTTVVPGATVAAVATALQAYFLTAYQHHITQVPGDAVPAGQSALQFIVGGYDPGSRLGVMWECTVPGAANATNRTTNNAGLWWIGQTDVLARILNGFDPRALTLGILQAAHRAGTALPQLEQLSYIVNWNNMTLQDAIDFVIQMIRITATIQRFANGIVMQPGGVTGVGGPIDVAVVRPGGHVEWIARKSLQA